MAEGLQPLVAEEGDRFGDPVVPSGRDTRRQLPEEVASYVRELILSGQVKTGQFLRLEPIAEALGVSNTPVREGLLSLRAEGLIALGATPWFRRRLVHAAGRRGHLLGASDDRWRAGRPRGG